MACGFGVLPRVAIRRVVATQGGATLLTRSQVHPLRSGLFALLTHTALRVLDGGNGLKMRADVVGVHPDIVARFVATAYLARFVKLM